MHTRAAAEKSKGGEAEPQWSDEGRCQAGSDGHQDHCHEQFQRQVQ